MNSNFYCKLKSSFFSKEKVYEEINTVFSGDKNKSEEFSELTKLTFLDQCIRESLRKLSVVPAVERRVTNDVVLSGMPFFSNNSRISRIENLKNQILSS